MKRAVRFSGAHAAAAAEAWGFNCGPGALCAVLHLTPAEVRPLLGEFEAKGYTNPTLMEETLARAGARFHRTYRSDQPEGKVSLRHGLVRVQFGGPWTRPGVPMRVRYRQTHWIAMRSQAFTAVEVFDINAMEAGGWIPCPVWEKKPEEGKR